MRTYGLPKSTPIACTDKAAHKAEAVIAMVVGDSLVGKGNAFRSECNPFWNLHLWQGPIIDS
jgi:hypothetical protein